MWGDLLVTGIKLAFVFLVLLTTVPIMVWVERRGSALIQDRLGPNRVGPFGLLQPVVDVVKLLTKENIQPAGRSAYYHGFKFRFSYGLINLFCYRFFLCHQYS